MTPEAEIADTSFKKSVIRSKVQYNVFRVFQMSLDNPTYVSYYLVHIRFDAHRAGGGDFALQKFRVIREWPTQNAEQQ